MGLFCGDILCCCRTSFKTSTHTHKHIGLSCYGNFVPLLIPITIEQLRSYWVLPLLYRKKALRSLGQVCTKGKVTYQKLLYSLTPIVSGVGHTKQWKQQCVYASQVSNCLNCVQSEQKKSKTIDPQDTKYTLQRPIKTNLTKCPLTLL